MKKHTIFALLILFTVFFIFCSPTTAFAEGTLNELVDVKDDAAREVAVTVCNDSGRKYSTLTDGDHYTRFTARGESSLTISSDKPFASLYLQFDRSCFWSVTLSDSTVLEGGKNGFIHEFLPLKESTCSVVLDLPNKASLCDIYAFEEGEPPSWVQRWEPPCESADLLLFPTHADDEHLWFGGAMPYYAGELGYDVQVAYMTNHWDAMYRTHELLNGLWTVGVKNYPVFSNFADLSESKESLEAAKKVYKYNDVVAWQVEVIRRFKPKVIIGHDIKGEYGHGAHILNAKALLTAVERSNDPSAYKQSAEKYGAYEAQKCYLHLWKENQIQVEWGEMHLSKFGGKTALEMAAEGYACHESQRLRYKLDTNSLYDCRKFGLVYTSVGPDTGLNDMFENVVWSEGEKHANSEAISSELSKEEYNIISPTDDKAANDSDSYSDTLQLVGIAAAAVILVTCIFLWLLYIKKRGKK